jgi:hypothetical protein
LTSIASPFGIKSRRRARTISGKAPAAAKIALASDRDFGDRDFGGISVATRLIFPGATGTPGRPLGAVFVFLGLE